jgi:hypothetical protein
MHFVDGVKLRIFFEIQRRMIRQVGGLNATKFGPFGGDQKIGYFVLPGNSWRAIS